MNNAYALIHALQVGVASVCDGGGAYVVFVCLFF